MPVEFKKAVLANGLEIVAEVDPAAHTAAVGFYVKAGARDEDSVVMGVSHFLEHMMFKGSDNRRAADVDRDFDSIGADHNAFTSGEMTAFWSHTLPEHLPEATGILADILRPALRQQDFDDEKSVILEEIAMYEDQPFWVVFERTMERYYAQHPLGHRVLGTKQTIENLKRDQMKAYFDHRYSADNTTVAFAGRIDFDAVVQMLDDLCGGWNTTRVRRAHPEIEPLEASFTLDSESVNRQYAIMVAPAPPIQDDRRYAAAVLTQILGDADGSRLYWALVETGLAEEARAQYDAHDGLGTFLVYWTCSPGDAGRVEQAVCKEIDTLLDTISQDDLVRVRSKIATSAIVGGELPAGRMHRLGRLWTYTGVYRSLDEELRHINAVTLKDVRDVYSEFPFRPRVTGSLRPTGETD